MLLLNGCCRKQMKKLQRQKIMVDAVVTDPPYHFNTIVERFGKEGSAPAQFGTDGAFKRASTGFLGKEWDGGDIAFDPMTWSLCLGLLKPGGHLIAFSASRNYHRMAVAIEDAGFEIRDQIMWIYGSGFPKSHNIGKQIDDEDFGWGTALKPAHEPIVLARKPISEKSIADNVLKWGTGGINIDECRVEGNDAKYPDTNPDFRDQGRQSKENMGIDKLSFGQTENVKRKKVVRKSRDENGVWTNDNSGMKAEGSEYADADPRGRFPSNVMHDGSDVVKDIFPKTGTKGKAKYPDSNPVMNSGKYAQNENAKRKTVNRQPRKDDKVWTNNNSGMKSLQYTIEYEDSGDASRYFYCAKTSKAERNQGLDNFPIKNKKGGGGTSNNVWYEDDVNSASGKFGSEKAPSKNVHPTVKPIKLMKYLCRLITPKGGTILDPFMGSGSTGMAAKEENFDFVGIEKEEEYFNIASARIESVEIKSTLEGFYD